MKILVIGSGGSESALIHTFARQGHRVWCLPGNGGTGALSESFPGNIKKPDIEDHAALVDLVKKLHIDLTVVGSEQSLADGIADDFEKAGLLLFGPKANAVLLGRDKAWSKQFMQKQGIRTPNFVVCQNSKEAHSAIDKHFEEWGAVVIKASGLNAPKGITICHSYDEANQAVQMILDDKKSKNLGNKVIVEQLLEGTELSIMAFCDGTHIISMPPSQVQKKLGDGDEGPNTEGMGAFAPVSFVTAPIKQEINRLLKLTSEGLQKETIDYRGVLSIELMLTKNGIYVLDYKCCFKDPETQVVLPLLKSDLAKIMKTSCEGTLNPDLIKWLDKFACCVVMVAEGYPFIFPTGDKIIGLDNIDDDILIFQAGTKLDAYGNTMTAGGRVLGVTGIGKTLKEALDKAYKGVRNISFVSAYYRDDIAFKVCHLSN